jgi:hypothetical protein
MTRAVAEVNQDGEDAWKGRRCPTPHPPCYINEANIKEYILRSQNVMLSDDDDEGACIVRTWKCNYKVMC